jgi:tetratricopeptide (TPR) repeat protein
MRKFSMAAVLVAGLGVALAGCSQVAGLKGKMAFKDANALYQQQDYRKAAEKYEEALAADPNLTAAYFFLGNSYDNLFKPARRGEAANDQLLTKAIENYKKAAELEQDPKIKKLALEYLVAAYGPDKMNDPTQAEPMVQRMIELDPKDPANYFALAKIYEDTGNYEQAEATLIKAREAKPNDPAVYMQLAGYYNRQGEFEKTIEALEARTQQEPNNPEAFYTIATYYWDKAYRDFRLPDAEKKKYVESGVAAVDKAISLKNDYMEALVYKNLLLVSRRISKRILPGSRRC